MPLVFIIQDPLYTIMSVVHRSHLGRIGHGADRVLVVDVGNDDGNVLQFEPGGLGGLGQHFPQLGLGAAGDRPCRGLVVVPLEGPCQVL